MALTGASVRVAPAGAAAGLGWTGVYTGSGGVAQAGQFAAAQGAPVRWSTAYLADGGWGALDDPSWYLAQWPASTGLSMDWAVQILQAGDTLAEGAAGAFNAHYLNLARAFVAAGQPSVTFRLGWEPDVPSQPWYAGSDPADFAAYWRQIVTTMRSVPGQAFKFDWNAGGSPPGDPVYAAYPGDAYVDYVTNDIYDGSWRYSSNTGTAATHAAVWGDISAQLAQLVAFGAAHAKPIGLPEWGLWIEANGQGGGDDPAFMQNMFQWLTTTPSLAFAVYYDADNDGYHNLYDGLFPTSAATWTQLVSAAAAAPGGSGRGSGASCPGPADHPLGGAALAVAAVHSPAGCQGYWVATAQGAVGAFGSAPALGSLSGALNAPIVAMAATPDGGGYWLLGADGGVFSFGDARFFGSTGALRLNRPVVGMAATPDGGGYWLVASDGGVFSFGDARFLGSLGGLRLNRPVVSMAATPDGAGYYMVASDGGLFAFGDATFRGSMGGIPLVQPVVGMSVDPATGGYRMVASDGGIFSFACRFFGSLAGAAGSPVTSVSSLADGSGYYLLQADGAVRAFGAAQFLGEL